MIVRRTDTSEGPLNIDTTFGRGSDTKVIEVSYLIVNVMLPYNIILGQLVSIMLEEVISTRYLVLKYPLLSGRVREV